MFAYVFHNLNMVEIYIGLGHDSHQMGKNLKAIGYTYKIFSTGPQITFQIHSTVLFDVVSFIYPVPINLAEWV